MDEQKIKEHLDRLKYLSEMIDDIDDDSDELPSMDFVSELEETLQSINKDINPNIKSDIDFSVKIVVKKLYDNSIYSVTDNKIELYVNSIVENTDYDYTIKTGLEIKIPNDYIGLIVPYSEKIIHGNKESNKTNVVGFLYSSDYGELSVSFKKTNSLEHLSTSIGKKIAQIILIPFPKISIID